MFDKLKAELEADANGENENAENIGNGIALQLHVTWSEYKFGTNNWFDNSRLWSKRHRFFRIYLRVFDKLDLLLDSSILWLIIAQPKNNCQNVFNSVEKVETLTYLTESVYGRVISTCTSSAQEPRIRLEYRILLIKLSIYQL